MAFAMTLPMRTLALILSAFILQTSTAIARDGYVCKTELTEKLQILKRIELQYNSACESAFAINRLKCLHAQMTPAETTLSYERLSNEVAEASKQSMNQACFPDTTGVDMSIDHLTLHYRTRIEEMGGYLDLEQSQSERSEMKSWSEDSHSSPVSSRVSQQ